MDIWTYNDVMRVAEYWRRQESQYMGPDRLAFEIQKTERQDGEFLVTEYVLRTKLFNRRVSFSVNGHGSQEGASKMVMGLKERGYTDESILELACEMALEDEKLGVEFVENVADVIDYIATKEESVSGSVIL